METNDIHEGRLIFFNESKFWGFLKDENTGTEYFCHGKAFMTPPSLNDKLRFKIGEHRGKPCAVEITRID
jgi:cold shock CspA family protein